MLLYDRNNVTEHCYGRRLHMDEDLISKYTLDAQALMPEE